MGTLAAWGASARRQVMRTAERWGVDDHVKQLRALTNRGLRRDLRDHEALSLVIASVVGPSDDTIDIGANHGHVLAELLRVAPGGRQMAFEPIPELAADLRARFPTADVREAALSDAAGETSFQHVVNADGYSGLRPRDLPGGAYTEEIRVKLARLDDELPADFEPSFVKIDVEGGELQVILGGLETIKRSRPVIAFESGAGASDQFGTTPEMLYDVIVDECGMRIFDLAGDGPYDRERLRRAFYHEARQPVWNYLACP